MSDNMCESADIISVLPVHVANKIAAGEVVERPASVVKELVENAVDAGAKNIKISIARGGRKLISICDDGSGMSSRDALLCLERQATSKIHDVDDIENIATFGFRGEAIPSIASVSRLSITTRQRTSDEGFSLTVNAGSLDHSGPAGCPPGTTVEVRDLFCNVPARRKFLKTDATEESHIKHVYTIAALSNHTVAFSLNIDGREVSRLAPSQNISERVADLFGPEYCGKMLQIKQTSDIKGVSVSGYIEIPNNAVPTRREQYIFVNGRAATAPSVAYALREAYPRKQGDVKPAAIIFISLPPSQVDVNVHPMKREVRFRDNASVKAAIMSAIESTILPKAEMPQPPDRPSPEKAAPAVCAVPPNATEKRGDETEKPSLVMPTPALVTPKIYTTNSFQTAKTVSPVRETPVQVEFALDPDSTASKPWQWFRVLASTESGYLLAETDAGIVTIWPRAARERITYEKLLSSGSRSELDLSQQLLIPEAVKLPPLDFARLKSAMPELQSMGFKIEEFGNDTFKIEAVPQIIEGVDTSSILLTIAHDLADFSAKRSGLKWKEELIAKSVAKSFAGSSDRIIDEEAAEKLISELASCRMPYISPRSKPTMIFTSFRELDRKFSKT